MNRYPPNLPSFLEGRVMIIADLIRAEYFFYDIISDLSGKYISDVASIGVPAASDTEIAQYLYASDCARTRAPSSSPPR